MPYTQPSPQPQASDGIGTAGLQVTTFAGPSLVVEIRARSMSSPPRDCETNFSG
jgi:hypothetical protein